MAAITICSDFGAQKNKVSHCFPIYLPVKKEFHLFSIWLLAGSDCNFSHPVVSTSEKEKRIESSHF